MLCSIPGANVKVLGKAIHALAKIGEELYIEPVEEGLAFRTVNTSRSAYVCFTFNECFFENYNIGVSSESDIPPRCKISMKCCLTVFRSLTSIEKTVEKCDIELNTHDNKLVFLLSCKYGIVRTFSLSYIECETLQAVFCKEKNKNFIVAPSRLLLDAVQNFQTNQEEITLNASPEKVVLKNYTEDEPDPTKVIHTEMTLDPDEFEEYRVNDNTDVTFCMKEFRAMLSFTDNSNYHVATYFQSGGKPIIFSIENSQQFEAVFVLATLNNSTAGESISQLSQSQEVEIPYPNQTPFAKRPNNSATSNEHRSANSNEMFSRPSCSNADRRLREGSSDVTNDNLSNLRSLPQTTSTRQRPAQPPEQRISEHLVLTRPQTHNPTDLRRNVLHRTPQSDEEMESPPSKKLCNPENPALKTLLMQNPQRTIAQHRDSEVLASDTEDEEY